MNDVLTLETPNGDFFNEDLPSFLDPDYDDYKSRVSIPSFSVFLNGTAQDKAAYSYSSKRKAKRKHLVTVMSELPMGPDFIPLTWEDYDVFCLYEGLMVRSLQQLLNPHSRPELRREVYCWIFAYPILGPNASPEDDADREIADWPFSYETTCYQLGVDPIELRCNIKDLLRRTGIDKAIEDNLVLVKSKVRRSSSHGGLALS